MPAKHYAITRIKAAKNAWRWVVSMGRSGGRISKQFPDLKLGGKGAALAAALKWRDEMARKNLLTFRQFHAQKRSNNTSGMPGVHRTMLSAQPMGSWQAKIKLPDGRKITKTFAIKKFGEKDAFRRAVAARKVMLDSLDDRLYLKSATAKRLVRTAPARASRDDAA